jgi:hypothetical protein
MIMYQIENSFLLRVFDFPPYALELTAQRASLR